jgi:hypothetical protein
MDAIYDKLIRIQEKNENKYFPMSIEHINKIVNPFEFIYTNVPGSTISVSKVKPDSIIFFELMEIFKVFTVDDILSLKHKINIAHLTPNFTSTNYLMNMIREDNNDCIFSEDFNYNKLYELFIKNQYNNEFDLIICEFQPDEYNDIKKYMNNMILILLIIIKYQSNQGICIIKIDNILYKTIIDVIFILSGIYDKTYLVKPSICNIIKSERYLICKGLNKNKQLHHDMLSNIGEKILIKMDHFTNDELTNDLTNHITNHVTNDKYIFSIIDNDLPYYLLNKLEESNLVICQQQLNAYDQIINIIKNKNSEEKIENLKKTHIQKCIQWCEKNQLPHNKFIDKVNIFLSQKKIVNAD